MYGPETLEQVAHQSQAIVARLAESPELPVRVVWKPVLLDSASIHRAILEANRAPWLRGRHRLDAHLLARRRCGSAAWTRCRSRCCTCTRRPAMALPWSTIDMDFMNLNQAAHGDREFGYIQSRLGVARKTVAGHVDSPDVVSRIAAWARAAVGRDDLRHLRLARFGDNMRDVAVTEGDKVEAQLRFGVSVNTYGVNDLVAVVDQVDDADIDTLVAEYADTYRVAPELLPGGERHDVPPLRRPHRARAPHVPGRGRLRRVHHELRGPRRPASAARPRRAAADGRRPRLRRRGRLEDLGAAARHEGDGGRAARRHLLHGGLHLPPGPGRGEGPRRPHARGLPDDHPTRPSPSRSTR